MAEEKADKDVANMQRQRDLNKDLEICLQLEREALHKANEEICRAFRALCEWKRRMLEELAQEAQLAQLAEQRCREQLPQGSHMQP